MNKYKTFLEKNKKIAQCRINAAREQKLTFLDLSGLHLDSLPDDISDMTYLLEIDLSHNNIQLFPTSLAKLDNLLYLDLSHNSLIEIEFETGKYYSLLELNISYNFLTITPESIENLGGAHIIYDNNPFAEGVPGELGDDDFYKAKRYLELIKSSSSINRIYETKLIFVGRGEVGKTTLMKTLKNEKRKVREGAEKTTHGINIDKMEYQIYFVAEPPHYNNFNDIEDVYEVRSYEEWRDYNQDENENDDEEARDAFEPLIPITDYFYQLDSDHQEDLMLSTNMTYFGNYVIEKSVQINLWDFGGQEIYHSTHQFFLTRRSIYLFVWEPRQDNTEEEFDYWLNTINLLGKDSPIIVVQNKCDIRYMNIDEKSYKNKFPNIYSFKKISCISKEGINELKTDIKQCIKDLPHLGKQIPSAWLLLRATIKNLDRDYILYRDFCTLCNDYNILFKEDIDLVSEYLHDIGEIIHFKDDPALRQIVIINPQWATKSVYALINTREIQKNNGRFELEDLEKFWESALYPFERHLELLQLMEKFQICFKLLGARYTYIIPELLQHEVPNNELLQEILEDSPLKFQFSYNFMPTGLIPRLICKLYLLIYQNNYWKNGVILIDDSSRALVKEDRAKKTIDICVSGDQKYNLLAIIRNEFKTIHLDYNMVTNQMYSERIPCNCSVCSFSKNPYYYPYQVIKGFINQEINSAPCYHSAESVNLHELIAGYKLIRPHKKFIYLLLSALSQLQGQHRNIIHTEDARNSYVSDRLSIAGLHAKDQSRWGVSGKGKNQGELDIKVEDGEGNITTIFEGLNLTSLNRAVIDSHINKVLLRYDPNGLPEKFIVIYYDGKDFLSFTLKYISHINDYQCGDYKFIDIVDESENVLEHTEIKVLKSTYKRSGKIVALYHILVNLQ